MLRSVDRMANDKYDDGAPNLTDVHPQSITLMNSSNRYTKNLRRDGIDETRDVTLRSSI